MNLQPRFGRALQPADRLAYVVNQASTSGTVLAAVCAPYPGGMLVAQVSDTHITTGVLASEPAYRAFQALDRLKAMVPLPDCVVITGDLADRGLVSEYEAARDVLDLLEIPVHVMPGNHDDARIMLRVLADTGYVQASVEEPDRCYYRVDYPTLRLLCCDSSVPGRHEGKLGSRQLHWLAAELAEADRDDTPVVVAMHHPPVRSGIVTMDEIMLSDTADLAEVLQRHGPVQRVIVGHLHRSMTAMFAGTLVTSGPSTYRQVHLDLDPRSSGSFVDEPPGILLHKLGGDEEAITHLLPVCHSGPPTGRI